MIETPQQLSILGLPIHLMDDYVGWLMARIQKGIGTHVVTLNAEMTILCETHEALKAIVQQADLTIPDGSGIVFYLRLHGKKIRRCPGIELAEGLLQVAGTKGQKERVFFYGGAPGVAKAAALGIRQKYPDINIVGTQHGFIRGAEIEALQKNLIAQQPQLIFVGLGVPRQELWIAENRSLCPQATWIGVGGSLDIWAGIKSRAPMILANNHLEWLYRLYQEPWRWRRMTALPIFARKAIVYRFTHPSLANEPLPINEAPPK
jgi:N-acetylglucosaminyldiphosphoundecaprenol N-acetyl-beta-D-mannosaminyltransferase